MSRFPKFGGLLGGHEVRTVPRMDWAGILNGDFLRRAAEAGFEALLTVDQDVEYQQYVTTADPAMVVFLARTNRVADSEPLIPPLLQALSSECPGQVLRVE